MTAAKPGDVATCPMCGARITLQSSRCPCALCKLVLYIPAHDDSGGKLCFASRYGWKKPTVEHAPSDEATTSGEAKP